MVEVVAHVLGSLGVKRALVVHGMDKLDEISASEETFVCELNNGEYKKYHIKPEEFGLPRGKKEDILGGSPEENAQVTRDILSGKITDSRRVTVLMNAGAAIYAGGAASSIAEGVKKAAELIDNGEALARLDKFIELSKED